MNEHSVLLINEGVMKEKDVDHCTAQSDLHMMIAFTALERTEKQFKELLEREGFGLVAVWKDGKVEGETALFETVLKNK